MADVTTTSLDETDELGITGLHFQHLELAPRAQSTPEHDAAEEIYVVLSGGGTLHAGQDEVSLAPDTVVRVGATETHHVVAGDDGLHLLAVATQPGRTHGTNPEDPHAPEHPAIGGG